MEWTRKKDQEQQAASKPLRLFYSYSHKDESLRNELETHFKLLERQGLIQPWHDRRIEAGEDFAGKIDENQKHGDIILLLVRADFIASDYCWGIEMKHALERDANGDARVIPIIVRDCNWKKSPFRTLERSSQGRQNRPALARPRFGMA